MNQERRKKIDEIKERLEIIREEIFNVQDEENEEFNNLPAALQEGKQGDKLSEVMQYLYYAQEDIGNALNSIKEAQRGK
jgi:hypothetical protein